MTLQVEIENRLYFNLFFIDFLTATDGFSSMFHLSLRKTMDPTQTLTSIHFTGFWRISLEIQRQITSSCLSTVWTSVSPNISLNFSNVWISRFWASATVLALKKCEDLK